MSSLQMVKAALRVVHCDDDLLLARLLSSALSEYRRFTGRTSDEAPDLASLDAAALNGVVLMVQADYDGDPQQRDRYRRAAEVLWQPDRVDQGV